MPIRFSLLTKTREENKIRSPLGWCLILSLAFHALWLLRAHISSAPLLVPTLEEPAPIEISTYLPPTKKDKAVDNEKQVAETEDNQNREVDPNAKYLSEHDQKAERDTRAKEVDDFRKHLGTGTGTKPHPQSIPPEGQRTAEKSTSAVEEAISENQTPSKKGTHRNWKTLTLQDLSVQGDGNETAASDDKLANADRGERTILSTREYKFYGYYHRIKELLRQYWKPNVEHQLTRIWGKGRAINEEELTTKVLVLLNEEGKIQKISRLEGSGFSEIDEAAIDAFSRAAPFPNPPQGMIDPDGLVRIRWDFILTTDAGPKIQWKTAR